MLGTPIDHSHRRTRSGRSSARGGWHEHRQLPEDRPRAERGENSAVLQNLDTPLEDCCDAVGWVSFFEKRRASCCFADSGLSIELIDVLVYDESKGTDVSNRC